MDNLFEKAFDYVSEMFEQEQGDYFLFISEIVYTLMKAETNEELTKDEILKLAEKIEDACGRSTVGVLAAERMAAVCYLLENGFQKYHFEVDFDEYSENGDLEIGMIEATPEQMKQMLLNCDMDTFIDLVDFAAVVNVNFYQPMGKVLDRDAKERINKAVSEVTKEKDGLDEKILTAEKAVGKQDVAKQQAVGFERE